MIQYVLCCGRLLVVMKHNVLRVYPYNLYSLLLIIKQYSIVNNIYLKKTIWTYVMNCFYLVEAPPEFDRKLTVVYLLLLLLCYFLSKAEDFPGSWANCPSQSRRLLGVFSPHSELQRE